MPLKLRFWGDERDYIAGLAAQLREQAKQRSPPFSTHQLIARCCPNVAVTGDRLWPGTLGLTRVDGSSVAIFYRRGIGDARQREVIGHELGHLFLEQLLPGDERRCEVGGRQNRREIDFTSQPTNESRCDYFGDELLVPLVRLREDVGRARLFPPRRDVGAHAAFENLVDAIAGRYRITKACIRRRLRLLEETASKAPPLAPVIIPHEAFPPALRRVR